jgi:hypothetical protein
VRTRMEILWPEVPSLEPCSGKLSRASGKCRCAAIEYSSCVRWTGVVWKDRDGCIRGGRRRIEPHFYTLSSLSAVSVFRGKLTRISLVAVDRPGHSSESMSVSRRL